MIPRKAKAIVLFSGGMDSVLSVKLLQDQNCEILGLNFISPWDHEELSREFAVAFGKRFDIPVEIVIKGQDYVNILRRPRHGVGSGANPCIDCRIHMLKIAKSIMERESADFIATGEVVGQRPMSQKRQQMDFILRKTELEGRLLRPLSAGLLPPTDAERKGLIDRDRLESIQGRTRKRQLELAVSYGVTDIPAGGCGCLLTDGIYAAKVRDLFENKAEITPLDFRILALGRHFRPNPETKMMVGRDERENLLMETLLRPGTWMLRSLEIPGPSILIDGPENEENMQGAWRLLCAYTKLKTPEPPEFVELECLRPGKEIEILHYPFEITHNSRFNPWRITP